MPAGELILAIDQGSSSTKALLVDRHGAVAASAAVAVGTQFPRPGWVEQSAAEIADSVRVAVRDCLVGQDPSRVAALGFSTQRESLLLWERSTGAAVGPLISWQDQRTAADCDALLRAGHADVVRERSGLPLDPMFSATKARWLLDHTGDRRRADSGDLCLGTVDSWLLFQFGAGEHGDHVTEVGNAARTQLMNIHTREWDPELIELFSVPATVLPRIAPSTGPYGGTRGLDPLPDGVPITAVLGDSHAALFAHAGWEPGTVKATYGTGSSVMGMTPPGTDPGQGLCLTVAWQEENLPSYAAEGNIRSSGSTLAWLARAVDSTPAELAALAADAAADGVHLVPAFSGLGAPWWDRSAVGTISGLTLGTGLPQLARAALESIAFQVQDVVAAMDRIVPVDVLLADGGAAANPVLMQLQADVSGRRVERADEADLSALGAAHLAGLQAGLWTRAEVKGLSRERVVFRPEWSPDSRSAAAAAWRAAVRRSRLAADDAHG